MTLSEMTMLAFTVKVNILNFQLGVLRRILVANSYMG